MRQLIAREREYFKVADFYCGQEINTPAKRALWNALMNLRGGVECTRKVYEKKGKTSLHMRGMRDWLKSNIDPVDLQQESALRVDGNIPILEKQKIVLSNMVSNLANQFRTKFVPIYHMLTNTQEPIINGDEFIFLKDLLL